MIWTNQREKLGEPNAMASRISCARKNKDAWMVNLSKGELDDQQIITLFDLDRYVGAILDVTVPEVVLAVDTPSTLEDENWSYNFLRTRDESFDEMHEVIETADGNDDYQKTYNTCKKWMNINPYDKPSKEKVHVIVQLSSVFEKGDLNVVTIKNLFEMKDYFYDNMTI